MCAIDHLLESALVLTKQGSFHMIRILSEEIWTKIFVQAFNPPVCKAPAGDENRAQQE